MSTKQLENAVSFKYENGNITPSSGEQFTNDFCDSLLEDKAQLIQSNQKKDQIIQQLIASNKGKDETIKKMQKGAAVVVGTGNKK